ncbi:hypothetical protein HK101_004705, partial [Irineochytrium annulatum]
MERNEEVLRLLTIPNILLNTTSIPPDSTKDTRGCFEIDVDYKALSTLDVDFIAGDWGDQEGGNKYDVILTSETIYSAESHARLDAVIRRNLRRPNGMALVAAKTSYFGCSGSLRAFEDLVTGRVHLGEPDDDSTPKMKIDSQWQSGEGGVMREVVRL